MKVLQAELLPSREELIDRLNSSPKSILLGENVQSPSNYAWITHPTMDVGLVINVSVGPLNYLAVEERKKLMIGYNCQIDTLDLQLGKIISSVDLLTPFYAFAEESTSNFIVAIHETGVVSLAPDGRLLEQYFTCDIIVDWHLFGNMISISTIEGNTMSFEFKKLTT